MELFAYIVMMFIINAFFIYDEIYDLVRNSKDSTSG